MPAKKLATDLPYNASAEQAVLGSALLTKDALYNVLARLEEDDFYVIKHKIIFRAIVSLFQKKSAVDTLTVTEELINAKELENIGGVEYLKTCTDAMVALSSLEYYINIVNDQSVLRKLVLAVRGIDKNYIENEIEDVNQFIIDGENIIKEATSRRRITSFKDAQFLAKDLNIRMNTPITVGDDNCTGLTSGYYDINKYTSGFHPGDMIIIAARPSVGKTALALNIAYNAASHTNKPVAIFSLEMSSELLMERMLGIASRVKLNNIKNHNFSDRDKVRINQSIHELSSLPIFIDDTSSIKLMDILANSRRLHAEHPDLGLIIVDYLSLVTNTTSKKSDSRQEEVRQISLALKSLAKELKVPVIAVSQLSRNVEQRGDNKRPLLSDLRESGSIEQDADVVMLLYREDYYKGQKGKQNSDFGNKKLSEMNNFERFETMKQVGNMDAEKTLPGDASLVEVNVAKNRNGQTGTAELFFYKEFGRFDQPTKEWKDQMRAIKENYNNQY